MVLSLVTIVLHIREKRSSWELNAVRKMLGLYIYGVLRQLYIKFSFDFCLILYSCYGWYRWGGKKNKKKLRVTRVPLFEYILLFVLGIAGGILLGDLFAYWVPGSKKPYYDGFHTLFVMITYILLAEKKREAWLFWSVANITYIALFWGDVVDKLHSKGALESAQLLCKYVGYIFLGLHGLLKWHRAMQRNTPRKGAARS